MKRKVCVYTSSRADYGLLRGVLQGIKAAESLKLQILASGAHLAPELGMTVQEIRNDGFEPDEAVEILLSGDTPSAVCKSMGLALIGYGAALNRLRPDVVVLLGDRFETFCMAAAAQVCRVPVAHIHGGESTQGAIDEAFRHSITKMAHLHFASCAAYRLRIIQMGEHPDKVFNVGALGVENIRRIQFMGLSELSDAIKFNLDRPYFLVTFHPVTLEKSTSKHQFKSLLTALDSFPEYGIVFTQTNADTDGRVINRLIERYVMKHAGRCLAAASLGARQYLSAMKFCSAVVGNSSSGIVEAPSLKVPTVNIGDRQKGRIRAASVIDTEPLTEAIRNAIRVSIAPDFRNTLNDMANPYEQAGTASRIVSIIASADLDGLLKKSFFDIPLDCRFKSS